MNKNFEMEEFIRDFETNCSKAQIKVFLKGETITTYIEKRNQFCILISGDTLQVIDFKYGKGVKVEAEENPQMKLYALGALDQFGIFFNIKKVKMSIIQPRLDNISTYEIPVGLLLGWGDAVVKPQAQKAFMGLGEFSQGEHCRFCRAKRSLRVQSNREYEIN